MPDPGRGPTRTLILAAASATIWFDDPAIGWPSIPMTVIAGRSHSRSNTCVSGCPASVDALAHAPVGAQAVDVVRQRVEAGAFGGARRLVVVPAAVERGVAVLVDERREHARQPEDRVGDDAAGHPAVHRAVERAQPHVDAGETAQ